MGTAGTADRARDGCPGLIGDPSLDLGNDLTHHDPSSPFGGLRHHMTQAHQRAHQVNVGLDRIQQLGLEQHRGQIQSLDGISLHDLHHAGRKVGAYVAEPTGDSRRGRAEPARSAGADAILVVRVIQCSERGVHLLLLPAQGGIQLLGGRLAEQQPPAQQPVLALRSLSRLSHGGHPESDRP